MKQRLYLPAEYAEILAQNANRVGISPDLYIQNLILQNHICGGQAPATPQPKPAPDEGITLSGDWAGTSL